MAMQPKSVGSSSAARWCPNSLVFTGNIDDNELAVLNRIEEEDAMYDDGTAHADECETDRAKRKQRTGTASTTVDPRSVNRATDDLCHPLFVG
jgi:hypothetical protein